MTGLKAQLPLLVLLGLWAQTAAAQDLSYEISASEDRLATGQSFQVFCDITTSGGEVGELVLPSFEAFEQLGQSRSDGSRMTIVNGQLSATHTIRITLTLAADQPGTHTIGPGSVRVGAKTVKSNQLKIVVGAAGAQPKVPRVKSPKSSGHSKLFLALAVDQDEVFLGQQLTVTLTLYSRVDLSDIQGVRLPDFKGVVVDELQAPQRVSPTAVVLGNRRYRAYLLRRLALFPTRSGTLEIGDAEVTAVVGGGFFNRGQRSALHSEPVEITVKPLPVANRPANFASGNIGQFQLQVTANQRRLTRRDPLTVKVAIRGQGNFHAIEPPPLTEVDGFRIYQPTPFEETQVKNQRIHGRKGYEVLLQPMRSGALTIPALSFTFFDPTTGEYKTVKSKAISVQVDPWKSTETTAATSLPEEAAQLLARPVRQAPAVAAAHPALSKAVYTGAVAALQLSLLGLLLLSSLWRRRQTSQQTRQKRLRQQSQQQVQRAAAEGDAAQLGQAMEQHLEVLLGQPVLGLTRDTLDRTLQEFHLTEQTREMVLTFLDATEAQRFAPRGMRLENDLGSRALELLQKLESTLPGQNPENRAATPTERQQ